MHIKKIARFFFFFKFANPFETKKKKKQKEKLIALFNFYLPFHTKKKKNDAIKQTKGTRAKGKINCYVYRCVLSQKFTINVG